MGIGNPNPHELNEGIERHLLQLRLEAEQGGAAVALRRPWRFAAVRLLKGVARWFFRAAERLEVGHLEEQASGA